MRTALAFTQASAFPSLDPAGHQKAHDGAIDRRDVRVTGDRACARSTPNESIVRVSEGAAANNSQTYV